MIPNEFEEKLKDVVKSLYDLNPPGIKITASLRFEHGDYTTNIAFVLSKQFKKKPQEIALELAQNLTKDRLWQIERIEAVGGFVNFFLSQKYLLETAQKMVQEKDLSKELVLYRGQKIMVEYAHPNTHKEMHVGHLRTLLIGESLARIFEYLGATVFRANYQGDIGLHVAKAIFGLQKILERQPQTLDKINEWSKTDRARLLGQAYVQGNQAYETAEKEEVNLLNFNLYAKSDQLQLIYQTTRQWSLEYFDDIYRRLGTRFDCLFFESEVADEGKKIVEKNVGQVFERSEGAIVFPGEKFGLHRRVFVTQVGNPTYEAKDMGLFIKEFKIFPFDQCIHVVANEQSGYFSVVFEAVRQLIQKDLRFKNLLKGYTQKAQEIHLPMGIVNLVGRKMSSRTGDLITINELLEEVKKEVQKLIAGRSLAVNSGEAAELITQAAVKYAYLKVDPTKNLSFDIKQSISLDGDSGPYLQYTYARVFSLLQKAKEKGFNWYGKLGFSKIGNGSLEDETLLVFRQLERFNNIVCESAKSLNPGLIASYLFDLGQKFNNFYNQVPVLQDWSNSSGEQGTRVKLLLVEAAGKVLKQGLNLLGISILDKM